MNIKILAIDIGGTYIKFSIVCGNDIQDVKKILSSCGADAIIATAISMSEKADVIAVSCGGFWKDGKCLGYENIENANQLMTRLSESCGRQVKTENDAICTLLCESKAGALKGCDNAAVLVLGTSVGCAVKLNGRIFKGAHGLAASMFLMPEKTDGENYVFDFYSNSKNVVEEVADGEVYEFKELCKEAKTNDKYSKAVNDYINAVALKCLYIALTFDVEKIALGGAISENTYITENIKKRFEELVLKCSYNGFKERALPDIGFCLFGQNANLLGAALLYDKEEL